MSRYLTSSTQPQEEVPDNRHKALRKTTTPTLRGLVARHQTVCILLASAVVAVLFVIVWAVWPVVQSPDVVIHQAEAASQTGDWDTALQRWRALNHTKAARSTTYLGEARACLALGRAAQAEQSIRRAIAADPKDAHGWQLLLEILRVEDRLTEMQREGWHAYDQVRPEGRRLLLREVTLGLLSELPNELVRSTLERWVTADPDDIDAHIALIQRIATQPRVTDPDRSLLLLKLERILQEHPENVSAREALVATLADSGEPDRGHTVLNEWPDRGRDARYWRLRGRWELEYEHHAGIAVVSLRRALLELPHDWRSWYRLARGLHSLGREQEASQAAEAVRRIRAVLDPRLLGPQLDATFNHLDDSAALTGLARICRQVGLGRLADAWQTEANALVQPRQ
jgi:predicted Zn-dependent protease